MSEADLDILLQRGERRIRANGAVRAGLASIGILLIASTLFVAWLRLGVGQSGGHAVALSLPALGILAALIAYFRLTTSLELVAWNLDRRAKLAEHLVTWLCLRKDTHANSQFRDAQRNATLTLVKNVNLKSALPIELPVWSRALWMGVLLLLSALLMPPRAAAERSESNEERGNISVRPIAGGAGIGDTDTSRNTLPSIQVLSPAELRKLQLIASRDDLPASVKIHALSELMNKIGALPESELSPDLRELIDTLQKSTDSSESKKNAAGSSQSTAESQKVPNAPDFAPANVNQKGPPEKAWAQFANQFDDLREPLERYYKDWK